MKKISIEDFCSKDEIIGIVNRLGSSPLKPTSHSYQEFGSIKISEAAKGHAGKYYEKAKTRPAIQLLEVILAANRNYTKVVKPNIERIEKTDLKTFDQLITLFSQLSKQDFFEFWGHKDDKKYLVLKSILERIPILREQYPEAKTDFELLKKWGENVDLTNYKKDKLGEIKNVAIATLQHLRMIFGQDTVKPDQRVKEVLVQEFNLPKLDDVNTVLVVEQIGAICGKQTLFIDQVFVNYGSGYYNKV